MASERQHFTERRKSPRYLLKQDVDIILENGDIITVESRNISISGMQVFCDGWVLEEIEPGGIHSQNINLRRFKICMQLDSEDATKKFYASCRVISQQRLSQDEFMLNLTFVDFENGSDTKLLSFLERFFQKKTVASASA